VGIDQGVTNFPAQVTIRVIFALASVQEQYMIEMRLPPGHKGYGAQELAGLKSNFDTLNPRPMTKQVTISGKYTSEVKKPFSISTTSLVKDGN
jgi:hypothetical protein